MKKATIKRKFRSCAKWSKIGKSTDEHETLVMARGVCDTLTKTYNHGSPCEIRGTCLKSWVEKLDKNNNWVPIKS